MANTTQPGNQGNTSNRGFASMDPQKQREIASKGGKAAHESGHAHEFDSEEAREAGRKGGESVSRDSRHMAEIGKKGGENSHGGQNRSGGSGNQKKQNKDHPKEDARDGSREQHSKADSQNPKSTN
jgi:general stress protein YciG